MDEAWRVIPGFENYEVSDQGRVRNRKTGRIHKPKLSKKGYSIVCLQKASEQQSKRVHRLVLLAFVGPSELECNHKNGLKSDNRLANLEYVSRQDNMLHASRQLGSIDRRGERNGKHKLTVQQVREIRKLFQEGRTRSSLAKQYEIHRSTVEHIVEWKSWKHVK